MGEFTGRADILSTFHILHGKAAWWRNFRFFYLPVAINLSVCLLVYLDSRFMTVDPTDLRLCNSVLTSNLRRLRSLLISFPLSGFPQGHLPSACSAYPWLFYLHAYTDTDQTVFPNKVFSEKVDYALSSSCLNWLRYLNVRRIREEWLLISETGFKKYWITAS